MLDDLSFISRIDKNDALGIASKEPEQLLYDYDFKYDFGKISNVVYTGMGGSALAASLSLTWPGYNLPFEIVRNYTLPEYVNNDTLCIVSSSSGNTEETISALTDAEKKNAKIAVITCGGRLLEVAKEKGYPVLVMPSAKQPRYGVFYNLRALIEIGLSAGFFAHASIDMLIKASDFLKEAVDAWAKKPALKPISISALKL